MDDKTKPCLSERIMIWIIWTHNDMDT